MARSPKQKKKSSAAVVRAAGGALDMLVRQFSQPLACLRELVQNAIDAGSNQIEVSLEALPEDHCYRLAVADTGEGMSEEVVHTQLTRLFSSAKENDLTKVGKFGIGFVSVFALEPEAVVVDTGRDGEYWRVLFHPDRSFDLIRRDVPTEGTTVALYLGQARFPWQRLLAEVRSTLLFWCRHCHARVLLNGELLSQPFTLDAPLQIAYEESGTRLVAALSKQERPFYGFYNQGLTLLEGQDGSHLAHVSFKLDSRYFEHTLTRDNLVRNADFDKAMALLQQAFRSQYPPHLARRLRGDANPELWGQLDLLESAGIDRAVPENLELFSDHSGKSYSLKQLRGCSLYYQAEGDELQEKVHAPGEKRLVLRLPEGHPGLSWLERRQLPARALDSVWGLAFAEPAAELEPLLELCWSLAGKLRPRAIQVVRWHERHVDPPLFLTAPGPGAVVWEGTGASLLLNRQHPLLKQLLQLQVWSPPLAAQLLLQHLVLLRPEAERAHLAQSIAAAVVQELRR